MEREEPRYDLEPIAEESVFARRVGHRIERQVGRSTLRQTESNRVVTPAVPMWEDLDLRCVEVQVGWSFQPGDPLRFRSMFLFLLIIDVIDRGTASSPPNPLLFATPFAGPPGTKRSGEPSLVCPASGMKLNTKEVRPGPWTETSASLSSRFDRMMVPTQESVGRGAQEDDSAVEGFAGSSLGRQPRDFSAFRFSTKELLACQVI